jgi:hypothetical protein
MNTTCPRCGSAVESNSRFCTNCGAVLEASPPAYPVNPQGTQGYRQSWESAQPASHLPSWATNNQSNAGSTPYAQQQAWSGQSNPSAGGSLGFNAQNDALMKKVLAGIVATVLGTIVLLFAFGLLAYFIPGLRCAFLILLVLIILIPWFIYTRIRSYVRRTFGRIWWFM